MIRRPALAVAALVFLTACGSSPAPAPDGWAGTGQASTDSPIAGETLRCAADYPDSRLVFSPDGTLGGRFAGGEVSGRWHAPAPGRVRVVIRTGGITIRDTISRTATGWRGEETRCG